ncbi:MAG: hypothetical protein Q9163_005282 [Psora crenata]
MESSKVPVEYSDPCGVFSSLQPSLQSRLPLRNLHWNSSSRPLRSIACLHIEFLPSPRTASSHASSAPGRLSENGEHISTPQDGSPKKERRHQIPGLRQTPYLKVYLVDCDDVDTYKAITRKELRDWVKDHALPSQSSTSINKQENHDAFEWLIVHVTFTPGEGSNRSRHPDRDSEGARKPSGSRWSSRNSKSVVEKIRSDFNGTSKNAIDRVTQVQLPESTANVSKADSRSQDGKEGWEDLVAKLKLLILASFNLRVQQYEEDIKEKELQRNLPGWNFNTFFVLKEGLARGFESVGLVDDALASYHELAISLSATVDEELHGQALEQQTARFAEYTDELHQAYVEAIEAVKYQGGSPSASNDVNLDPGATVLDTERKPFRDLILANNISIFDFQGYVFARQISLLLRLANAAPPKQPETEMSNGKANIQATSNPLVKPSNAQHEDLSALAEICRLSLEFITSTAWTIRRDIGASRSATDLSHEHHTASASLQQDTTENIVASWTFSACQRILSVTSAPSLSVQIDPLLRQLNGTNLLQTRRTELAEAGRHENDSIARHKDYPRRTSSLTLRNPSKVVQYPEDSAILFSSLDALRRLPPGTPHPGAQELAGRRGDLLSLSRRSLSTIAFRCKAWNAGLDDLWKRSGQQNCYMDDIDLSGESEQKPQVSTDSSFPRPHSTFRGVCNAALKSSLQSEDGFYFLYEDLTKTALAHYVVGNRSKMAQTMTADLAVLCFQCRHYIAAASYFKQLASFYNDREWVETGKIMLDMWAECLRKIGNVKEYIVVALKALARAVVEMRSPLTPKWFLNDLIADSATIDQRITVPFDHYLVQREYNPYVSHYPDRDGFRIQLQVESKLYETFKASSVRVKIVSLDEKRSQLWLSSENVSLCPGLNKICIGSAAMVPGWYVIDHIMLEAENIVFVHESFSSSQSLHLPGERSPAILDGYAAGVSKRLLVWAAAQSLGVDISDSEEIDLSGPRSIVVTVSTGWNNISHGTISLRPASAGLRLHTAEAKARIGEGDIAIASHASNISFNVLLPDTRLSITIPYTQESDLGEIQVHGEVAYATEKGNFSYASSATIRTGLSLAVNVVDTFKQGALFSHFTIGTATSSPLRIIEASLRDNNNFETIAPVSVGTETDVFAAQPLSLVAEIRHKHNQTRSDAQHRRKINRRLYLDVDYRCLAKDIWTAVEADLLHKLASTALERFSRVLSQHLRQLLCHIFTSKDFEMIGLLREVNIGAYDDYDWEEIVQGLGLAEAVIVKECLQEWHQDSRIISLERVGNSSPSPVLHLTVPVDLPELHVLHTASLRPRKSSISTPFDSPYVTMGQALPMELVLEHTRQWGPEAGDGKILDFCYDIQASPETWLVGGQRRARFTATEGHQQSFSVLLLPQSAGHLLLPAINIQPVVSHHDNGPSDSQASPIESFISSQTDYVSQAETILVLPGLSSTTVRVEPNASQGEVGQVG